MRRRASSRSSRRREATRSWSHRCSPTTRRGRLGAGSWRVASVPPLVTQIADGENGGVMMNEFPSKYMEVVRESSGSATAMLNGTEYLERLFASGVREEDLPVVQPLFQHRIWDRMDPGDGPERLAQVIADLGREDDRFHMDGGSWTNNISWVRGYDDVLIPMERASAQFHERVLAREVPSSRPELPQRALSPARERDQLLPLLGRGRVDGLRSRARAPRDGDRCARSVSADASGRRRVRARSQPAPATRQPRALARRARAGGHGDSVGDRPHPALAVALRGRRTRPPVAFREPARDARQPRLPTPRLRNRRLRVTVVVPAEHPRDRAARHRLLPSRPAADPVDRPGGAPGPMANDRRPSLCRAITPPGSGRPSWASPWTWFPPCAATATAT